MNNDPNLHPIWHRHFGLTPKAATSQPPAFSAGANPDRFQLNAAIVPSRPQVVHDNDGWVPTTRYRPAPGAPVGVRKQVGRNLHISTTVLPGDARYPVEFLVPSPAGGQA